MTDWIPIYKPDLTGRELDYVTDCINSGWISSIGDYVERFEQAFAEFCGTRYAVAVSNGTVALQLALLLKDIGPGDEVLVPDLTFVATANVVTHVGAKPVFIDADPVTWTIDARQIETRITNHTKAIIPVHLYGHPANMDPVLDLAEKYSLFVIEDAAEAHGAEYKGKRVGSLGHVGAFSFYGNKVITTGEGGMLTTNDPGLAERARFLKDHAMTKENRYWHPEVGYNFRMTNIQAAIGLAQLERIDALLRRKIEIAGLYRAGLKDCSTVVTQPQAPWAKNIYWLYSILMTDDTRLGRDALMAGLRARGVDSRPFFHPMHTLPPYCDAEGEFPVALRLSSQGLNLPSYPTLTDAQIIGVCEMICELRDSVIPPDADRMDVKVQPVS